LKRMEIEREPTGLKGSRENKREKKKRDTVGMGQKAWWRKRGGRRGAVWRTGKGRVRDWRKIKHSQWAV